MRICLVSQEYPPETGGGGIGTQTYLKAHGLTARGHEVHVVCASWDGQTRTYRDGCEVIHRIVPPALNVPGYEVSTSWMAYSTAVAGKLHELDSQVHFDIIQFPEYGGEGFVYQTDTFAYRTSRYVVQLHGPLGMFAEHMGWPDIGSTLHQVGCFMERSSMHHADRVLASSHSTARFCADHYKYSVSDIEVIHSAVDIGRFKPGTAGSGRGGPEVLFVGRPVSDKGIDDLITAVLAVRESRPCVRLRIIGNADDDTMAGLSKRIADAEAQNTVEFVGYVPHSELPEHYRRCDIFAAPSTYEPGPGNIYLEAMACGKPIVACNSGGAPEVVLDGETGILVKPGDASAIAGAIGLLAGDGECRKRLGTAGRKWIESRFTWEKYTDRVERIYSELLA